MIIFNFAHPCKKKKSFQALSYCTSYCCYHKEASLKKIILGKTQQLWWSTTEFLTVTILIGFEPVINFSQVLWSEPDAVSHSGMSQYLWGIAVKTAWDISLLEEINNFQIHKQTCTSWSCSCPSWLISRRLKISSGLRLSSLASSSWPSCTISWLSIRPFSWASCITTRHSSSDKNPGISAQDNNNTHLETDISKINWGRFTFCVKIFLLRWCFAAED